MQYGSLLRSFTDAYDDLRYWKLCNLMSYMLHIPLSLHITSKTWYCSKLSATRFHAIHELNLCNFKQVIASLSYFYLKTALKFPSKCFWSEFFSVTPHDVTTHVRLVMPAVTDVDRNWHWWMWFIKIFSSWHGILWLKTKHS